MSLTAAIPRFLLPRRSALWRPRLPPPKSQVQFQVQSLLPRHASTKASSPKATQKKGASSKSNPSKPLVLEKPTKFVPPSHGSRLRKEPPRYPGPNLSAEEKARMKSKKYPNMMPPPGTWMHSFLHNKSIHMYLSLGVLFSMALTVFVTNFKRDSPFADMLPHWTQMFVHPIQFTRTVFEVLKLHQAHVTAETQERRKRKVEDVAKRSQYRKAHGLENEGFGSWTAKTDGELLGPGIPLGEGEGREGEIAVGEHPTSQQPRERKVVKKWLGIW